VICRLSPFYLQKIPLQAGFFLVPNTRLELFAPYGFNSLTPLEQRSRKGDVAGPLGFVGGLV
jgi:hypothetical protein